MKLEKTEKDYQFMILLTKENAKELGVILDKLIDHTPLDEAEALKFLGLYGFVKDAGI